MHHVIQNHLNIKSRDMGAATAVCLSIEKNMYSAHTRKNRHRHRIYSNVTLLWCVISRYLFKPCSLRCSQVHSGSRGWTEAVWWQTTPQHSAATISCSLTGFLFCVSLILILSKISCHKILMTPQDMVKKFRQTIQRNGVQFFFRPHLQMPHWDQASNAQVMV